MLILMLARFYHKTCSIYEFLHHDTYSDLEISHLIQYFMMPLLFYIIKRYVCIKYYMAKMEDMDQSALP